MQVRYAEAGISPMKERHIYFLHRDPPHTFSTRGFPSSIPDMSQNLRPKNISAASKKRNWPRARAVVLCQGQATPDYTHSVNTCTPAAPPLFCSNNQNHRGLRALYRERDFVRPPHVYCCLLEGGGGGRPLAVFLAGYVAPSHFLSSHIS